jgi:hypothetical protein
MGGLEAHAHLKWRPFMEGTYARGDFALHFFERPDKLEQMRIASKGSLSFWS